MTDPCEIRAQALRMLPAALFLGASSVAWSADSAVHAQSGANHADPFAPVVLGLAFVITLAMVGHGLAVDRNRVGRRASAVDAEGPGHAHDDGHRTKHDVTIIRPRGHCVVKS